MRRTRLCDSDRMTRPPAQAKSAPFDWLPDRHLHVVATLAHADELITHVAETLRPLIRDGAIEIENRYEGGVCLAMVKAVKPVPPAVSRYAADALTQLRAALEHVLFTEVRWAAGRELTVQEAQAVEMPACTQAERFTAWLNHGRRKPLGPLQDGSPLVKRMRQLQPYNLRNDPEHHPLRLLVTHTNTAKHQTPIVAATRVARVVLDSIPPGVEIPEPSDGPVRVGDVLAIAPAGVVLPMDVWPTISIQRPHTGEYPVLITELASIADWVRKVAIPILVTGTNDVDTLPAHVDTTIGWADPRAVIAAGNQVTAAAKFQASIGAATGREGLRNILKAHSPDLPATKVRRWIADLTDDEVVTRLRSLVPGTAAEAALASQRVVDSWVADVQAQIAPGRTEDAAVTPGVSG